MGSTQRNYYLSEDARHPEEMGQGEGGDDLGELQQVIDRKNLQGGATR